YQLGGKWGQGYDCILPDGNNGTEFNGAKLKAMPNDAQSPLVQGIGGLDAQIRGDGSLNKAKGATSVWDYADGVPGVCKMQINGHQRVDLNFYPGFGSFSDVKQG